MASAVSFVAVLVPFTVASVALVVAFNGQKDVFHCLAILINSLGLKTAKQIGVKH